MDPEKEQREAREAAWEDDMANQDNPCGKCEGSGQISNDDDETPWQYWAALKPPSNLAVQMGLVYAVECPKCKGTGGK